MLHGVVAQVTISVANPTVVQRHVEFLVEQSSDAFGSNESKQSNFHYQLHCQELRICRRTEQEGISDVLTLLPITCAQAAERKRA